MVSTWRTFCACFRFFLRLRSLPGRTKFTRGLTLLALKLPLITSFTLALASITLIFSCRARDTRRVLLTCSIHVFALFARPAMSFIDIMLSFPTELTIGILRAIPLFVITANSQRRVTNPISLAHVVEAVFPVLQNTTLRHVCVAVLFNHQRSGVICLAGAV